MKKITFAAIAVATLIIGAPVVAQIVPGPGPAPTERVPAARGGYGWGPGMMMGPGMMGWSGGGMICDRVLRRTFNQSCGLWRI